MIDLGQPLGVSGVQSAYDVLEKPIGLGDDRIYLAGSHHVTIHTVDGAELQFHPQINASSVI